MRPLVLGTIDILSTLLLLTEEHTRILPAESLGDSMCLKTSNSCVERLDQLASFASSRCVV
jgi:hypothetical protein